MSPEIKLLMRLKLNNLRYKAKMYNLSTDGTKIQLAMRIANHETEVSIRLWDSISNGGVKKDVF
uniref:SAP domain-containing protein n=1 Tax=viral metagenome TaxID=1070528 RepID=A0A6M3JHA2_9ZZZZ